jgi:hypothetical protein
MNQKTYFLDLSLLPHETRVEFLLDLLAEKHNAITFNLSSNNKETMTMVGKNARSFTLGGTDYCEPLIPWQVNTPEVILQFLNTKLKETNQSIFPRYPSEGYTRTVYDCVTETDKIDWAATVSALVEHSAGNIRTREGDSDYYDRTRVTNVGGRHFNVRVDFLGTNSHNKEIIDCEKAILQEYRTVFGCGCE